jgi:hypothetical protein
MPVTTRSAPAVASGSGDKVTRCWWLGTRGQSRVHRARRKVTRLTERAERRRRRKEGGAAVFFDSGDTLVGNVVLRRVLWMEEEVGDEGSWTNLKGFTWKQHSSGRWSQRRCSSSISTAPTCFRWPASDETQGSNSMEVSECSGMDERARSGETAHGGSGRLFYS